MNRIMYDQCYQNEQWKRSVMPFDMLMMPFRNEHSNPCRDDSPLFARGVPHQHFSSLVDVESDLLGMKLTGGKCNSRGNQYVPSCNCLPSGPCKCGRSKQNPGVKKSVQRSCPATPVYPATIVDRFKITRRNGPVPAPAGK